MGDPVIHRDPRHLSALLRVGPSQFPADRVEADLLQELARAEGEVLAEGVLDLAAAGAHGEGEFGDADGGAVMGVQPLLGATGEAGAVAGALARRAVAVTEFPDQAHELADEGPGLPGRQVRGFAGRCFAHEAAQTEEAGFDRGEGGRGKLADRGPGHGAGHAGGLPAFLPDLRGHAEGGTDKAGSDPAVDGFARRGADEQAAGGARSVPRGFSRAADQGDGGPAGRRVTEDARPHVGLLEVDGPVRGLELLDDGRAFLPAKEVGAEAGTGDGDGELVGVVHPVEEMTVGRSRRRNWREGVHLCAIWIENCRGIVL